MNLASTLDISKSSLVSLKAEILRKREELNAAKLQQQNHIARPQKPLEIKNKGIEARQENDTQEDIDMLKKSRETLERKAKLYDKLSKDNNKLNEDEIEYKKRMLVHFDKKKYKSRIPDLPANFSDEDDVDKYPQSEEDERYHSDDYDAPNSPGSEWVEYTDCLGRTRKCLRKDLNAIKARDNELSDALDPDRKNPIKPTDKPSFFEDREPDPTLNPTTPPTVNENSELLSSDMRRELLRQQWEQEEDIMRDKDDLHYQDILFNEARTHGVGYYGFSKDEEERAKQQQELNKIRAETLKKQDTVKEQKAMREKQLAARMKAARNRKRVRMGLPPEEDEPETDVQAPTELDIDLEQEEKKRLETEERERLKDAARKKEVRPWDIGKEGVKTHYEYTQEEWVDKKRTERPNEFAPPTAYVKTKSRSAFRSTVTKKDEDFIEPEKTLYFSSKKSAASKAGSDVRLPFNFDPSAPPPRVPSTADEIPAVNPYKRRNYVPLTPTPIVNECVDFDDEENRVQLEDEQPPTRGKGAEVPPPATFDYYGPSGSKRGKTSMDKANIADSISAGLKFLRDQAEKKSIANEKRVIYEH